MPQKINTPSKSSNKIDNVDSSIPMLERMFNKREKGYKAMGYQMTYADHSVLTAHYQAHQDWQIKKQQLMNQ